MSTTSFTQRDAADAILFISQAADERRRYREQFQNVNPIYSSDEENDSCSPIFDEFYFAGGPEFVLKMINFSPAQFHALWNQVCDFVTTNWNVGRGKKSRKMFYIWCSQS
jgi:hypothetical protein